MKPFSRGGLYLNFAGFGEGKEAMLRDAYGQNYDRLVALKTRYDPENLFRMNLNFPPVAAAASAQLRSSRRSQIRRGPEFRAVHLIRAGDHHGSNSG
jgi:hypothetical protein